MQKQLNEPVLTAVPSCVAGIDSIENSLFGKRLRGIRGLLLVLVLISCDTSRVYEKNIDLTERYWVADNLPEFEFQIDNAGSGFNLFINIRNEPSYPNANLYFKYYLADSTGKILESKLLSEFLFDAKTGKPFGNSVLGDIYDHRFPLLTNYTFSQPGKYFMRYEQFMRADTLRGIMAVGLRVEHAATVSQPTPQ